jgi:plasmid stabilization system protein ParE
MVAARYRVEWTEEAEGDALRIVGRFDSRIDAERMVARFSRKAASLSTFPERGRIVPELERLGVVQYREVFIGPWRLLYEVRDQLVFIVAALDGRRDLADLLFDRFVRP